MEESHRDLAVRTVKAGGSSYVISVQKFQHRQSTVGKNIVVVEEPISSASFHRTFCLAFSRKFHRISV
jgi:hypothetical protein